jgi:signal peptidase I
MYPTYNEIDKSSDTILIDIFTPKFSSYQRGDVVVARSPNFDKTGELYIKRVIGLPGETIIFDDGKVFIQNNDNPKPTRIDENAYLKSEIVTYKNSQNTKNIENIISPDEYYLMGDNRTASSDSRVFGPIKKGQILGKEFYRLTPNSGWFILPKYNISNL